MKLNEISLKELSREDLHELNKRVIAKIRGLDQEQIYGFKLGERVTFEARGVAVVGEIEKRNSSTVSVKLDNGQVWRVSPGILRKAR